ncbi:MAG: ATP-dependent RecD-like DNA helicase [Lentisphaerae bacterium ADurb.BinA184]|nr:MAG: ATP-dependent RecD-like DNA helicase [Lentisphaerae bacterium ADurb.BinA184]
MSTELDKIEQFFAEGRKLWPTHPEMVVSRTFFELWEEHCQPQPFAVTGPELRLAGEALKLTAEGDRIAFVTWNDDEAAPTLVVEGGTHDQIFLLGLSDGEAVVQELPPVVHEDDELSFGERLEIVYDVIADLRTHAPGRDVRRLPLKEFHLALDRVADRHPPRAIRVLRNLKLEFVRRLFERATEDMPPDELTPQLTLPLGDSYVAPRREPDRPPPTPPANGAFAGMTVPPRTRCRIHADLRFVAAACRFMAEAENLFLLQFAEAEILWRDATRGVGVSLPIAGDYPIDEGDRFHVLRHGGREPVGVFIADVVDRTRLCGRIEWNDAAAGFEIDHELVARPQRSPWKYLALSMEDAAARFRREGRLASPAVDAVLGLSEARAGIEADTPPPAHLDASQARGWRNAVCGDNPVVLVQGPPGTGKTALLETVIRELCRLGQRVLVTAPSNTAVDNVCRRVLDLPVLRFGNRPEAMSPDVAAACWVGEVASLHEFKRKQQGREGVFAGTHVGCLRDEVIAADHERNGLHDVIIFDEAGMSNLAEFLLCAGLAKRVVLFGDHQQLPPFPLPQSVLERIAGEFGAVPRHAWRLVKRSALEWLNEERRFPLFLLQNSYRCQNPRLMRFASTLFYDARVRPSEQAEYYRLSYAQRATRYPPSSLRLLSTSNVAPEKRHEALCFSGSRPGLENRFEAELVAAEFYATLERYPLAEISIITPYRRQARLIEKLLDRETARRHAARHPFDDAGWERFLATRVDTVDSFQGGESDAVIMSYVRSNPQNSIGFVDDPNRINVAHTRCRREMAVIADIECLKRGARSNVFERLQRAIARDGQVINVAAR